MSLSADTLASSAANASLLDQYAVILVVIFSLNHLLAVVPQLKIIALDYNATMRDRVESTAIAELLAVEWKL